MDNLSIAHHLSFPTPIIKQKILLVEDNLMIQLVHKTMLVDMQCEVDIADDAEAALLLLTKKYDLILLDIGLPGMNGIQLAKIIRDGTTINQPTAIYALTAYSAIETKQECFKSGIDRVLLKPITFEALESIIGNL